MTKAKCEICGEPMPPGEEMFKFHGYSGGCPKPPLPRDNGIEELVKMPEPEHGLAFFDEGGMHDAHESGYTADQLRAYGQAVAAAVAKRCIELVIAEDVAPSDFAPGVQECIANAIRREFGEAGNG